VSRFRFRFRVVMFLAGVIEFMINFEFQDERASHLSSWRVSTENSGEAACLARDTLWERRKDPGDGGCCGLFRERAVGFHILLFMAFGLVLSRSGSAGCSIRTPRPPDGAGRS
jgi:hypothetical protein